MVSRIVTSLLALGALLGSASAELDLTPFPSEFELEGVRFSNVYFTDGAQKTFYTPPRSWTRTGGGKRLSFTLPKSPDFQASLERIDLKQPAPFAADVLNELVADARSLVPAVATEVSEPVAEANPISVLQSETYEVTFGFTFNGRLFTSSVLYVNLGQSRLRCRLEVPQNDFAALHHTFFTSLCSFYR